MAGWGLCGKSERAVASAKGHREVWVAKQRGTGVRVWRIGYEGPRYDFEGGRSGLWHSATDPHFFPVQLRRGTHDFARDTGPARLDCVTTANQRAATVRASLLLRSVHPSIASLASLADIVNRRVSTLGGRA